MRLLAGLAYALRAAADVLDRGAGADLEPVPLLAGTKIAASVVSVLEQRVPNGPWIPQSVAWVDPVLGCYLDRFGNLTEDATLALVFGELTPDAELWIERQRRRGARWIRHQRVLVGPDVFADPTLFEFAAEHRLAAERRARLRGA